MFLRYHERSKPYTGCDQSDCFLNPPRPFEANTIVEHSGEGNSSQRGYLRSNSLTVPRLRKAASGYISWAPPLSLSDMASTHFIILAGWLVSSPEICDFHSSSGVYSSALCKCGVFFWINWFLSIIRTLCVCVFWFFFACFFKKPHYTARSSGRYTFTFLT